MASRTIQRIWHAAWWLLIAALIGTVVSLGLTGYDVTWKSSSGQPVHEDFQFLMYPKDAGVQLIDPATGASLGTLDRAVLATAAELRETFVNVRHPTGNAAVKATDLSAVAPEGQAETLRSNWAKLWSVRGAVDGAEGGFTYQERRVNGGITECSLILHGRGHITDVKSVWTVSHGTRVPEKIERQDAITNGAGVMAGVVVGFVAALLLRSVCKRFGVFPYKVRLSPPSFPHADGITI